MTSHAAFSGDDLWRCGEAMRPRCMRPTLRPRLRHRNAHVMKLGPHSPHVRVVGMRIETVTMLDAKITRETTRLEEKLDRGFAETQALIASLTPRAIDASTR